MALKIRVSNMKLGYFYLLMAILSAIVTPLFARMKGLFADPDPFGAFAAGLGMFVGLWIGPAVVVGIVVAIPKLLRRKIPVFLHSGLYTATWILFVYGNFVSLSWHQELDTAEHSGKPIASNIFSPQGCEYSLEFPGKPKVSTGHDPTLGDAEIAEFARGPKETAFYLKAQCFAVQEEIIGAFSAEEALRDLLPAYAKSNGLQNADYRTSEDEFGLRAMIRGYKNMGDLNMIFVVELIVGTSSILEMQRAGAAATFPQTEVTEFQLSLSRVQNK